MDNLENNSENITEIKLDNKDRAYATGKRKNSIARNNGPKKKWEKIYF